MVTLLGTFKHKHNNIIRLLACIIYKHQCYRSYIPCRNMKQSTLLRIAKRNLDVPDMKRKKKRKEKRWRALSLSGIILCLNYVSPHVSYVYRDILLPYDTYIKYSLHIMKSSKIINVTYSTFVSTLVLERLPFCATISQTIIRPKNES